MPDSKAPALTSQAQLQDFVTKYRLERATLDDITFYMNPDVQESNSWLIAQEPTGSGYVRWSWGPQPVTLRLDGTTGTIGYDSGSATLGGMKQLYAAFAPGQGTAGVDNQLKARRFVFPALGIDTNKTHAQCFIDSFQRSMSRQSSLYSFFSIQLTILPARIAKDYEEFTPQVSGSQASRLGGTFFPIP